MCITTDQRTKKKIHTRFITNGPPFSQHSKLERVKLAKYVDYIIIGGDEPEQKLSPSIFKKALTLTNVNMPEAIHVGDSLVTDIHGAKNLDITSIWINPSNELIYNK